MSECPNVWYRYATSYANPLISLAAAQAYNVEASMSEIYSAERRISDVKGLGLTEGSFKSMATLPPVKAPAKASPRMAGVQPLDRYATTTFQDDDMDHLTPRSRAKAEKEREKMLNELQVPPPAPDTGAL